jgi:hypothetical protein
LSSTAAGGNSGLYLVAVLVIIVLLRIRRVMNGTKISVGRTVGYSIYYVVFGSLFLSSSFVLGIPLVYFLSYPIVFIAAFVLAFELARRRVVFWRGPDGSIYSKGGLPIYMIYVVGLVARILIGYVYFGANFLFFSFPTGAALSGAALSATVASDLLLTAGIGLLFGRNMRILKKYLAIKSGKEKIERATTGNDDGNPSMPA